MPTRRTLIASLLCSLETIDTFTEVTCKTIPLMVDAPSYKNDRESASWTIVEETGVVVPGSLTTMLIFVSSPSATTESVITLTSSSVNMILLMETKTFAEFT